MSTKGKDTTLADWIEIPGLFFAANYIKNTRQVMWEDPLDDMRILVSTRCGGTWSLWIRL